MFETVFSDDSTEDANISQPNSEVEFEYESDVSFDGGCLPAFDSEEEGAAGGLDTDQEDEADD